MGTPLTDERLAEIEQAYRSHTGIWGFWDALCGELLTALRKAQETKIQSEIVELEAFIAKMQLSPITSDDVERLADEASKLLFERDALRRRVEGLEEYVAHRPGCTRTIASPLGWCTCGLDAALRGSDE